MLEIKSNTCINISNGNKKILEQIQHKLICLITEAHFRTAKQNLLLYHGLMAIQTRREFKLIISIRKTHILKKNFPYD